MSKTILLSLCGLFLFSGLQAQDDVPILLTDTYKKVKYAPETGAKFSKVKATKSLDPDGVIKLNRKSTAKVYCNGKFITLEGKGEYPIKETFEDEFDNFLMGSANIFNSMLMAAVGDDTKKTTDGSTADGLGNKKFDINSRTPVGKVKAGQAVHFQWSSKQPAPSYTFSLMGPDGETLHETSVSGTSIEVFLDKLDLTEGTTYYWKVAAGEDMASDKYDFVVSSGEEQMNAIEKAKSNSAYKEASPLMRKLMEAASLEQDGFLYAAAQAYKEAQQMDEKGEVAEKMYQAFEARHVGQ